MIRYDNAFADSEAITRDVGRGEGVTNMTTRTMRMTTMMIRVMTMVINSES